MRRPPRHLATILLALLACEPVARPLGFDLSAAPAPDPAAARLAIADAEVARADALPRLAALLDDPTLPADVRARALRALGRRGDPPARARLIAEVQGTDPARIEAAAAAIALLDDPSALGLPDPAALAAGVPDLEAALLAAIPRAPASARPALATALARVGGPDSTPALAAWLADPDPHVAAAAALALARRARRQLPLGDDARAALVRAAATADPDLRLAATHALAREHAPPPLADLDLRAALLARALDPDPETRAEAITALARRGAAQNPELAPVLVAALEDPSWLVQIAAVRGLAGAADHPPALDSLVRRADALAFALARGEDLGPLVHVLEDILERLAPSAEAPAVQGLARLLTDRAAALLAALDRTPAFERRDPRLRLLASRLHCRAVALATRGGVPLLADPGLSAALAPPPAAPLAAPPPPPTAHGPDTPFAALLAAAPLATCGGDPNRGSARHLRRALWAAVAGEGHAGGFDDLARLATDDDPHVQAAVIGALANLSQKTSDDPRPRLLVLAGLAAASPAVIGAAADAIAGLAPAADPAWLATAQERLLAALDQVAGDPELDGTLALALAAVLRTRQARAAFPELPGGPRVQRGTPPAPEELARARAHCEAIHRRGLAPLQAAAAACLQAAGAPPPPATPELADLPRPPASPTAAPLRLVVDTTAGVFTVDLAEDLAPWAVAALADLALRGFYDGLPWHRVVPGFVVQGGDPTGTGAGGPGFTLPGEPSLAPFRRGAVGIADAGLHTGGSQWFVMHARAPHLEGRYTLVGQVVDGLDVVDRLTTDDRIVSARPSGR